MFNYYCISLRFLSCAFTLALGLSFVPPLHADSEEYIREIDYPVEAFDTKYSARIAAIDELKLSLQHELGTYISDVLEISRNASGISSINRDTVQITAGIISLKLLEEQWRQVSYYVKGLMRVDPDEVRDAVKALREDTALQKILKESLDELDQLRGELAQLREKLRVAPDDQTNDYQRLVQDIEAEGVFQQAMSARIEGDFKRAFELLRELADKGYAKAQVRVGRLYEKGVGVEQDYERAFQWYSKADAQVHPGGKAYLGLLYENGLWVKRDPLKAVSLYKQAADLGSTVAFVRLGLLYRKGDVVTKDHEKAMAYFQRAADKNTAHGLENVGLMYEFGWSVPRDLDKAREFYERAAAKGSPWAMGRLGHLYHWGVGVDRDIRTARAMIIASAERGNEFGLAKLGELYEKGDGVEKNPDRAFKLYQRSAEGGAVFGFVRLGNA